MTLYKAIEATREAILLGSEHTMPDGHKFLSRALDTPPAKPMSEDEIADKIHATLLGGGSSYDVMRALKDAGVLYCVEGK